MTAPSPAPDVETSVHQGLAATVAEARRALGGAGEVQGPAGVKPRYELFHAASSICSQKVRVVLAHHHLAYTSQVLNMFTGQTYLPPYVRLRMIGCESYGGALVSHHTGNTSTSTHGCDGAVVPTLVDWSTGEVVVDSVRICRRLDAEVKPPEDRLRPDGLAEAIDQDLLAVDAMPNYQMLMGRTVAGGASAANLQDVGGEFSRRKVAWCTHYLEEHGADASLAAAYTAKRSKELSAANALFSPDAMRAAYDRAEASVAALERKLDGSGSPWLYRDSPTLADLFWAVELLRMQNVGLSHVWSAGRLPAVERFTRAAEQVPAIRTAVLDWPGAQF